MLCLNETTTKWFIDQCQKFMNYEQYLIDPTKCDDSFIENINLHSDHKTIYVLPCPPPMWKLCPIHLAVETPMHLQMNFSHYNASFILTWASISKCTQLIQTASIHMNNAKNPSVSVFKVISFRTNKFGRYVAEN